MSYKTKTKKLLSLITAVLIALSIMTVHVSAFDTEAGQPQIQSEDYGIMPLWDNVSASSLNLSFSNKKIVAYVRLSGIAGTKYKNGTVKISKYSGGKYVPVKSWTGLSSSSKIFIFSNSDLAATSGVKYKLEITITAYTSTKSEVITANKVATCP